MFCLNPNHRQYDLIFGTEGASKGNLFIGEWHAVKNREFLSKAKITHVLSALTPKSAFFPELKSLQIEQKIVAISDHPDESITPHFEPAIEFIGSALQNGNIFVHCAGGRSRSVSLVVAYLVKEKGMSVQTAIAAIKEKRPEAGPNHHFLQELNAFHAKVNQTS